MDQVRRIARSCSGEHLFGNSHSHVKAPEIDSLGGVVSLLAAETVDYSSVIASLESRLAASGEPWPPTTTLLRPLTGLPRNIICLGKNFATHAAEMAGSVGKSREEVSPKAPVFFSKSEMALTDPIAKVAFPSHCTCELDYEGEIAIVVGKGGSAIPAEEVWEHVFGFVLLSDITARDLQRMHRQNYLGKNLDGLSAIGPWVTLRDSVSDFSALEINALVNGELRQHDTLRNLTFGITEVIPLLSRVSALLPGDVISLGTPSGVGSGFSPPRYLQPGDTVRVEGGVLGHLETMILE